MQIKILFNKYKELYWNTSRSRLDESFSVSALRRSLTGHSEVEIDTTNLFISSSGNLQRKDVLCK